MNPQLPAESATLTRLGLTFSDANLEVAYRSHFFDTHRRALQAGLVVAILVTATFGPVDKALAPDRYHTLWLLRYGISLPVMLLAAPLVFANRFIPLMRRYTQEVILILLIVLFGILGTLSTKMLEGADFKATIAILVGWAVVMVTVLGVTRLRFKYALPFSLVSAAAAVVLPQWLTTVEPALAVIGGVCIGTVTTVGLISSYSLELYDRTNFVQARALLAERRRSDALVSSLFPPAVAEELKAGARALANRFESTTVLFADICGFTSLAESMSPANLVRLLDEVFARFDAIALQHGAEKVKTIGDAFMAVAGAPNPSPDHALTMARVAVGLQNAMPELSRLAGRELTLRVGIASGPVIAGVIGRTKPAWDVWGDTVNTAARMESHGEPGRTQIAASTAALIEDRFVLSPRGEVLVKGKGAMNTYWLEGVADGDPTLSLPLG